ncbi:uncharacterized protein LOC129310707 [Prosopis cineraria]|uniref:uncharacterized protein LOC129310707 n=1 Tax=Prosopis cineraria TaxID=364024 RepID=UPI00241062BD|nr:uncharacterized protein LOC129310707 [Prosopis cineraria]
MDDGYKFRKYRKKMVKSSPNPTYMNQKSQKLIGVLGNLEVAKPKKLRTLLFRMIVGKLNLTIKISIKYQIWKKEHKQCPTFDKLYKQDCELNQQKSKEEAARKERKKIE